MVSFAAESSSRNKSSVRSEKDADKNDVQYYAVTYLEEVMNSECHCHAAAGRLRI